MTNYFMVGTIHGGWHGHGAREMLDDFDPQRLPREPWALPL